MIPQNANLHSATADHSRSPAEIRAASTDPEVIAIEATDVLTPREAAAYLRASESWLKLMRLNDRGPAYTQHGRYVRYRRIDLMAWMVRNQRRPKKAAKISNKSTFRA